MTDIIHKSASFKQGEDIWYIGSLPEPPKPGYPGSPGYGAGIYEGDNGDLEESLELAPMEGADNPNSDNYGNYQNPDGSVFVFIPKFYYTFNCKPEETYYQDTIKYSGLTEGQLAQIVTRSPMNYMAIAPGTAFANETEANSHGFILHRAFIDGGQEKSGFFIMKYLASRGTDGTSTKALSVKNGHTISLNAVYDNNILYTPSGGISGCRGNSKDAIILSKAINSNLNCASTFMYSALAMQSKFIGTIVTSTDQCAWYDSNLVMNFPKGCNNNSLGDANDSSVTYTAQDNMKPLTGSGTPFAKTTHNGLNNGVCDLNGCILQITTGLYPNGSWILKESCKLSDITTKNVDEFYGGTLYDKNNSSYSPNPYYWGNSLSSSWRKAINGASRALEGIYPISASAGCSTDGLDEFGRDVCGETGNGVECSGDWRSEAMGGVFYRDGAAWVNGWNERGFRSGGYAS